MKYDEMMGDLFAVFDEMNGISDSAKIMAAHCVSSDGVMGAGIAPQFTKHFGTKQEFLSLLPNGQKVWDEMRKNPEENGWGDILVTENVINLITKRNVYDKPTYESVRSCLEQAAEYCRDNGITNLLMPQIACGIDGLKWEKVSPMIQEAFKDTDVSVTICIFQPKKEKASGKKDAPKQPALFEME